MNPRPDIWLVAIGLSLGPAVSNGLARFAYGRSFRPCKTDLGWNYTQAGWLNTANASGYLVGALANARSSSTGWECVGCSHWGFFVTPLALLGSAGFAIFGCNRASAMPLESPVPPFSSRGRHGRHCCFRDTPVETSLAISVYFGGGGLSMIASGAAIPLYTRCLRRCAMAHRMALPRRVVGACVVTRIPCRAALSRTLDSAKKAHVNRCR